MNRGNLYLNGLRAFEAAARHLSFKRAADELMVTHTAISYHVRQLEENLGVRLFEREAHGIELTVAGANLYPKVSNAFDSILSALHDVPTFFSRSAIKVTTTPSFAFRWLVPRLRSWRNAHERAIDVHMIPTLNLLDLIHDEADLAIRCGVPPWPGLTAHHLLSIHMTPVCSPHYLSGLSEMRGPVDLLNCTLLHADVGQNSIGTEWQTWLEAAGVTQYKRLPGLSFKDPALAWEAAISGLGFAIGYLELVKPDLASHNLERKFDLAVQHPFSYYLVYPTTRRSDPKISEFHKWIVGEIAPNHLPVDGKQLGANSLLDVADVQ